MIKISIKNILVLSIVGVCFIFFFVLDFFIGLEKEAYFSDFKEDSIEKLEIMMFFSPIDKQVTVSTKEKDEIEYFRNMFVEKLNGNDKEIPNKEKKLYDYHVYFKFYNKDGSEVYRFTVFVDKEKIQIRPVILRDRGESLPGGYYYILQDDDFKFYDDIFEIWSYKEIKI